MTTLGSPFEPNVSKKITHEFVWSEGEPSSVIVTGSFDNWTSSIKLEKDTNGVFRKVVELPFPSCPVNMDDPKSRKIYFKYVVDGEWTFDPSAPYELDNLGHSNNFLELFPAKTPLKKSSAPSSPKKLRKPLPESDEENDKENKPLISSSKLNHPSSPTKGCNQEKENAKQETTPNKKRPLEKVEHRVFEEVTPTKKRTLLNDSESLHSSMSMSADLSFSNIHEPSKLEAESSRLLNEGHRQGNDSPLHGSEEFFELNASNSEEIGGEVESLPEMNGIELSDDFTSHIRMEGSQQPQVFVQSIKSENMVEPPERESEVEYIVGEQDPVIEESGNTVATKTNGQQVIEELEQMLAQTQTGKVQLFTKEEHVIKTKEVDNLSEMNMESCITEKLNEANSSHHEESDNKDKEETQEKKSFFTSFSPRPIAAACLVIVTTFIGIRYLPKMVNRFMRH